MAGVAKFLRHSQLNRSMIVPWVHNILQSVVIVAFAGSFFEGKCLGVVVGFSGLDFLGDDVGVLRAGREAAPVEEVGALVAF